MIPNRWSRKVLEISPAKEKDAQEKIERMQDSHGASRGKGQT
jgi:hypothetical protein